MERTKKSRWSGEKERDWCQAEAARTALCSTSHFPRSIFYLISSYISKGWKRDWTLLTSHSYQSGLKQKSLALRAIVLPTQSREHHFFDPQDMADMEQSSEVTEASLGGLPTELRIRIFEHLLQTEPATPSWPSSRHNALSTQETVSLIGQRHARFSVFSSSSRSPRG